MAACVILDLGIEIRWHGEIVALEMGDDSFLELLKNEILKVLPCLGYAVPVAAEWGSMIIDES